MRFYTVLASRPQYYDRSPTDIVQQYAAAAVAPHANTVRWTYTCPSARKAFVSAALCEQLRDATASTAGRTLANIALTPSGGSSSVIVDCRAINVTIDTWREDSLGGSITMLAGDALAGATQDLSVGGTAQYVVSCTLIEFDA